MIKFEKVSFEQFKKDYKNCILKEGRPDVFDTKISDEDIKEIYDNIKLPQRSTKYSAGYDFYSPCGFWLGKFALATIPTGIRWVVEGEDNVVLSLYPRSGQGFKTGVTLANTVGIIDADYYQSDNEGHIMVKLTKSNEAINKDLLVDPGQAFCQGIITQFLTVDDDSLYEKADRNGGMGSTG